MKLVASSGRDDIWRIVELAHHEFPMVPVLTRHYAPELTGRARLGGYEGIVDETMASVRARDAERMALEQVGDMDARKALIHGNLNQREPGH
ncbi:MAG: hypothetical protein JJU24_03090 [Natronohydrobacter sp.]|nr:hypothetical protein [Natronohydrobacter sp.]